MPTQDCYYMRILASSKMTYTLEVTVNNSYIMEVAKTFCDANNLPIVV